MWHAKLLIPYGEVYIFGAFYTCHVCCAEHWCSGMQDCIIFLCLLCNYYVISVTGFVFYTLAYLIGTLHHTTLDIPEGNVGFITEPTLKLCHTSQTPFFSHTHAYIYNVHLLYACSINAICHRTSGKKTGLTKRLWRTLKNWSDQNGSSDHKTGQIIT